MNMAWVHVLELLDVLPILLHVHDETRHLALLVTIHMEVLVDGIQEQVVQHLMVTNRLVLERHDVL
jgi:hypothetical protein